MFLTRMDCKSKCRLVGISSSVSHQIFVFCYRLSLSHGLLRIDRLQNRLGCKEDMWSVENIYIYTYIDRASKWLVRICGLLCLVYYSKGSRYADFAARSCRTKTNRRIEYGVLVVFCFVKWGFVCFIA